MRQNGALGLILTLIPLPNKNYTGCRKSKI